MPNEKVVIVSRDSAEGERIRLAQARNIAIMIENHQNSQKLQKLGALGLIRFPDNITASPTWLKYEIFEFKPQGSGTAVQGVYGVNVGTSVIASIALSADSQHDLTESQGWSQEGAGGMMDKLKGQIVGAVVKGNTEGTFDASAAIVASAGRKLKADFLQGAITGTTVADKMSLKYSGPSGSRSFTMNHKFVPRNEKESNRIRSIIYTFRSHSSPEKSSEDVSFSTYKFPSLFKVTRMAGEHRNTAYPEYDYCYCKSVNVKYGEELGTTFYDPDGKAYPTQFEISLQFEELGLTDRSDIKW
jgi:hypothetical protein